MFRRWHLGFALLLALAFGFVHFTQAGRMTYLQRKREIREAFGLPKNWMTNFNEDISDDISVKCPTHNVLVVATGGQSNAANAASDPLMTDPKENAFMFYNGRCYVLKDPVLGATGGGGSLWSALGPPISRNLNRPVVFINGAVGGTQIGDWIDTRSGYGGKLRRQLALAKAVGYRPGLIIWIQGETDSAAYTSSVDYQSRLKALVEMLSVGALIPSDAKWMFFPSTYCAGRLGSGGDIQKATRAFVKSSRNFVLGPNLDELRENYRRDGCHFNSFGRRAIVDRSLPIIERLGL